MGKNRPILALINTLSDSLIKAAHAARDRHATSSAKQKLESDWLICDEMAKFKKLV